MNSYNILLIFKRFLLISFGVLSFSCENELQVINFSQLEPYLRPSSDKIHVVNFWATWCAPCVKELPYFEALHHKYKDRVEVILVNLDYPTQYESRLKPFLKKHKLASKVLVLNDPDMNVWAAKIDPKWDGAIPVTLIYDKNNWRFFDQTFDGKTLELEVLNFLN